MHFQSEGLSQGVLNCVTCQHGALWQIHHLSAVGGHGPLALRYTPEIHFTTLEGIEARQGTQQEAFTGTGRALQHQALPGCQREVNVLPEQATIHLTV